MASRAHCNRTCTQRISLASIPNVGLTVIRGVSRGLSSLATAPKDQETGGSVWTAIGTTQLEKQHLRRFLAKGQTGRTIVTLLHSLDSCEFQNFAPRWICALLVAIACFVLGCLAAYIIIHAVGFFVLGSEPCTGSGNLK